MIIDAFTFFNEIDILEARLDYLYDTVDYFVIVESNVSHSGKPKPFYYLENQNKFARFKNKIFYHPFIFDKSQSDLDFDEVLTETKNESAHWAVERAQREHISTCMSKFPDDAFVMISDADEIPNKAAINFAKQHLIPSVSCAALLQSMFYYDLSHMKAGTWPGTVFTTTAKVKEHGTQWFRDNRFNNALVPHIQSAGWHLSYFGGVDKIIEKIENFAHQEFNKTDYKDSDKISQAITNGTDLYGRSQDTFDTVSMSIFPTDFLSSFYKFRKESDIHEALRHISSAWAGHKDFAMWIVDYLQPTTVVDLGVDYGFSTFSFGMNRKTQIYGVDCFEGDIHAGFRNTHEFVENFKEKYNYNNITFIKGFFDKVASTWDKPIEVLHIDGLHTYDAVKYDYDTWSPFLTDDSVVMFHDTVSFADSVGRFFNELDLHKVNFEHSAGLGVASKNPDIIDAIAQTFNLKKNVR